MARDLRLWSGTVRGASFDGRLAAAVAGGFSSVSLFPVDVRAAGLSGAQMRARAADAGVRLAVIDPLTRWLPTWEPPAGMSPDDLAFSDFTEAEVLTMAQDVGAESISAIEAFGTPVTDDEGAEHFAGLCDRAAERGLRVHLEFQPYSGIADLASAWDIVRLADRTNGGLVFDVWHYRRGRPDDDLVRRVPPEKIFVVQWSDARAAPEGSLLDDTLHRRLLPGDGDFPLADLRALLAGPGASASMGAEVFSDELAALPPQEAGRRAGVALRALLDGKMTSPPSG